MPIDLAAVDWLYVIVLAILVFLSTLIGIVLAFRHVFLGALFSALLFVVGFVFWTYYPHGLPLPTRLAGTSAAAPSAPPASSAPVVPVKPANPVTDVTPPPAAPPK
jgi:hypothetical protein